ncbi:MAG: arginine--tRNA ligase [Bdellovibrionales bacterium]|nr:arginine--tRNA ligase [Bdellovibrionales bacterium]
MLTLIKTELANQLSSLLELPSESILERLESPKNPEHGHLAFPVFAFAKEWKKAPPVIAQELADKIKANQPALVAQVSPMSGFLNFTLKTQYLMDCLKTTVLDQPENIGRSQAGAGKRVIIDYSSPNVAKPMSIGHLRATVIGQAICNLAKMQGFEVVGLNHLGDWGTQFGKLAWAYQQWNQEYDFKNSPFESLFALYVRFHEEAEKRPELNEFGAETFKKLESGDDEITQLWKWFVEISLKEYDRLWALLGVKHDLVRGESFYNDRLKPTEKLLEDKGLLVESDGAMVVPMDDPKMPPCLIRKSDGASLYATRDIASAIYRMEELKSDIGLYVVGVDQTLHFKQVFEVLSKMGYAWAKDCHHISFGMYQFKNMGRMSSRKGQIIEFEDVVQKAIELVKEIIQEKNPELKSKDKIAEQVGVGAIIFNDLMNDRIKNVEFDWDKVLDFEGNSGPYVQYCNVRCKSLLRKSGYKQWPKTFQNELKSPEAIQLLWILLSYDDVLKNGYKIFKPHIIAMYLLDVCRQFSTFYAKNKILNENDMVQSDLMTLVGATSLILESALGVLNISAPNEM